MLSDRLRTIADTLHTLADEVQMLEREQLQACREPVADPAITATIQHQVAAAWRVPEPALSSKLRGNMHLSTARQVAIYLCREMTMETWHAIGAYFNRDHTTAIHSHTLVALRVARDREFAAMLDKLKRAVANGNGVSQNGVVTP